MREFQKILKHYEIDMKFGDVTSIEWKSHYQTSYQFYVFKIIETQSPTRHVLNILSITSVMLSIFSNKTDFSNSSFTVVDIHDIAMQGPHSPRMVPLQIFPGYFSSISRFLLLPGWSKSAIFR